MELTNSVGGLADIDIELCFNRCASDPGVFNSRPSSAKASGGRCPTHQDYPGASYPNSRCITFVMLLRDTRRRDGATYVYPGSRHLVARGRKAPSPPEEKPVGRPPKRKRSEKQIGLNPSKLDRALRALCGPPIALEGERLTIFRFESGDWHGALRNTSEADRPVLIWSFCSRELLGSVSLER